MLAEPAPADGHLRKVGGTSTGKGRWRGGNGGGSPPSTPWSLTTLREKLAKIGAQIVPHRQQVIYQLAEVAVPRTLFATTLP
jgi:hypothetical protein